LIRPGRQLEGEPRRGRTNASRALRLAVIACVVLVAAVAIGAASRPHSVVLSLSAPQLGEVAVLVALVLAAAVGLIYGSSLSTMLVVPAAGATPPSEKSRIMPVKSCSCRAVPYFSGGTGGGVPSSGGVSSGKRMR
jgi:hypothetical protein